MSIKDLVLKKGWAGKTLSRLETTDRIDPLIRILIDLMHRYDGSKLSTNAPWQHALKMLRMDIGKLSEIVNSNGGKAYTGTDIEPGHYAEVEAMDLIEEEEAFADLLEAEKLIDHQMRTRAVLDAVAINSTGRLMLLTR